MVAAWDGFLPAFGRGDCVRRHAGGRAAAGACAVQRSGHRPSCGMPTRDMRSRSSARASRGWSCRFWAADGVSTMTSRSRNSGATPGSRRATSRCVLSSMARWSRPAIASSWVGPEAEIPAAGGAVTRSGRKAGPGRRHPTRSTTWGAPGSPRASSTATLTWCLPAPAPASTPQRLRGRSYAEIAREGGGILSTMRAVRAASLQQLIDESAPRSAGIVGRGRDDHRNQVGLRPHARRRGEDALGRPARWRRLIPSR